MIKKIMSHNKPSTNAASKLHFIAPCLELFQTNIIFQFFIKLKRIDGDLIKQR